MDARHVSLSRILVLPNNSHPLHTLVLILVDENLGSTKNTGCVFARLAAPQGTGMDARHVSPLSPNSCTSQ